MIVLQQTRGVLFKPASASASVGELVLELLFEGANGSTTITNTAGRGPGGFAVAGGVSISTAQFSEGASSLRFSGAFDNNNSLGNSGASSYTDMVFGLANFRISIMMRFGATLGFWGQGIYSATGGVPNPTPVIYLEQSTGYLKYAVNGAAFTLSSTLVPDLNVWKEIRVDRIGGVTSLYYDSVLLSSGADTTSYGNLSTATSLRIGSFQNVAGGLVDAYMDELRVWNANV